MANILQLRKGNSAQNRGFLGSVGELTYDTELARLRVHNGATVGGRVIVGTRLVSTPVDANTENTTGVRVINELGSLNLPFDTRGVLCVYSNEIFVAGALRVYQTFQPDTFGDYFTRNWNGSVWSAWERVVKGSEKNSEAFGVGQTLIDVTASRATNTVYTNTTGKPILVAIGKTTQSVEMRLFVNGVQFGFATGANQDSQHITLYAVVPAGATYSTGGGSGFVFWSELR